MCEITPRNDSRDGEVIECNRLIHDFVECDENIFLARHSNLRENNYVMLHDVKHVSKHKMGPFVINVKRALYAAHGKQYIGRRRDANNIENIENMLNSNEHNNRSFNDTTMPVNSRLWNIANQDAPMQNNQFNASLSEIKNSNFENESMYHKGTYYNSNYFTFV